jgi:heat shock protein HspQ
MSLKQLDVSRQVRHTLLSQYRGVCADQKPHVAIYGIGMRKMAFKNRGFCLSPYFGLVRDSWTFRFEGFSSACVAGMIDIGPPKEHPVFGSDPDPNPLRKTFFQ